MTVSFSASGHFKPSAVTWSFMHFSMLYSLSRILSTAFSAWSGSTSVMKPRTPMFTASIGGSGLGSVMHVLRIVPSPPIVIKKSVFICFRGSVSCFFVVFPVKVSSK